MTEGQARLAHFDLSQYVDDTARQVELSRYSEKASRNKLCSDAGVFQISNLIVN